METPPAEPPADGIPAACPPALPPADPLDPLLLELLPVEEVLPASPLEPDWPEPVEVDGEPVELEGDGSEGAGLLGDGAPGLPDPLVLAHAPRVSAATDSAAAASGS